MMKFYFKKHFGRVEILTPSLVYTILLTFENKKKNCDLLFFAQVLELPIGEGKHCIKLSSLSSQTFCSVNFPIFST